jgi:DNA-directed RNA polymerase II subunit RPB1
MAGRSEITTVGFGLAGDEEIEAASYKTVTNYDLFDPSGQPVPGGVMDKGLGTTDYSYACQTCLHNKGLCPGHRGALRLRVAVISPVAVAEVRRWLRAICLNCGEIAAERERYINLPLARRLGEAAGVAEGRPCRRCGVAHPRIVKDEDDHFTFWAEPAAAGEKRAVRARSERRGERIWPDAIRAAFERVTDAAVEALGAAAHPRKLILRTICVPPNTVRPNVRSFGGASGASYHDSTNLLQHAVKRNQQLPERLPPAMLSIGSGAPPVEGELERTVQNLQQIYYDIVIGSSSTSATQGSSGRRGLVVGARPVHSFLRNLQRKEGRIRANLLGKRVFYISRSTISGCMRFRIDEVGIPLEFARTLQVKETVQEYNRDWLTRFFLNGRRAYPGCTDIVRRATGMRHDVAGLRDARLEVGDVLFRDVISGDYAFFNRAPTLERSSIGVHRVVVVQDPSVHTFQMNVLACELYNADFDGDQMNLWVAREPGARAEAALMSGIANWYISTKSSAPVNGQVQDSVIGCYELTRSSVFIDKFHAMALFATAGGEPPRFDVEPSGAPGAPALYSGRAVASMLFASTPVNYSRAPSSYSDVYAPYRAYDPSETLTVMERGVLTRGVLDKASVGASTGGTIYHRISREYGPSRALDLIFATQQVALAFLLRSGFTVGTADLLPGEAALGKLREIVSGVLLEAQLITDRLLRGEIVAPIGETVHEFYEKLQINALKTPESEIMRYVLGDMRPNTNGFFTMIATGSKGKNPNLVGICGAVGQTLINGERIRAQFAFGRTLAYYPRFSTEPAAHGFVANSYITGLRTGEFVFRDMHDRFDLINKALSTASTGYFMRKGVMNNQSAIVDNYRRVSKDARVVQFIYGEDGLDARELEKIEFRTVAMSDADLRSALAIDVAAACAGADAAAVAAAQAAADRAVAAARADRDQFRRNWLRIGAANFGTKFPSALLGPVNVARVVDSARAVDSAGAGGAAPPVPGGAAGLLARLERVEQFVADLPYVLMNEDAAARRAPLSRVLRAAAQPVVMVARAELGPRVVAAMTDMQLQFVLDAVRQRYAASLIDYGSAVGILAAQSISEPLTQYMLDSHHRSVSGGTNKSGLIRVSEIYGARPVADEQSSAMLLPLQPRALGLAADGAVPAADFAAAETVASEIATSLEFVTVQNFVAVHDVLLEPITGLIYPPYAGDAAFIAEFARAHPLVSPPADLTNWCFRLVLDKSALVLKAVTVELIVRRLRARHTNAYVVHTSESVAEIVVRVWLRAAALRRGDDSAHEARANEALADVLETPVRGIPGIMRAAAERMPTVRVGAGGALERAERWAVRTAGTNLYAVMMHRAVDSRGAISTSVGDTCKLLGIEAARTKIVSETRGFMEDGAPNLRHLFIYADEMTRTGRVTSIERGGLGAREHDNVLLRMSYGAPIQVVTDAALAGARSRVYGIAAPALLGSVPRIGTLYNTLVIDEAFVRANTKSVDSALDEL